MQHFLLAFLSLCAVSTPLLAQNAPVSSIRVTASAKVTAKPDRVEIDIGVTTHAKTSQEAAAENARQVDAVLTAVKQATGNTATLKTVSYTLNPDYQYHNSASSSGGEPTLVGYSAANVVQVTLDDLAKIGGVIDAGTHAGANQVHGIRFTLRDADTVRAEALRQAAARARAEAEVLAGALNVHVVRVLYAEENSPGVTPIFRPMAARAMSATAVATPVESGTLDITADVTLTVEVSPVAR
jgi:uncharacterized protein